MPITGQSLTRTNKLAAPRAMPQRGLGGMAMSPMAASPMATGAMQRPSGIQGLLAGRQGMMGGMPPRMPMPAAAPMPMPSAMPQRQMMPTTAAAPPGMVTAPSTSGPAPAGGMSGGMSATPVGLPGGTSSASQPFPGVTGSTGTNAFGYPDFSGMSRHDRRQMSRWQRRSLKNLPPWLQDPRMFQQAQSTILDILGNKGQLSPEQMIGEQSDIERGRGQAQDALMARMAAAGVDPSSPQAMSMGGTVDQAANRMQAENRRALDIRQQEQMRQDLNLVMPYLQYILGATGPKGAGGGITPVPSGGGGGNSGGADYAGMLASVLGQGLSGWAQGGFQH